MRHNPRVSVSRAGSRWRTVAIVSAIVTFGSFLIWLTARLARGDLATNDQTASVVSMGVSLIGALLALLSYVQQREASKIREPQLESFVRELQGLRLNAGEPSLLEIKSEMKRLHPDRPDLAKAASLVLRGAHRPSKDFLEVFLDACFDITSRKGIEIPAPHADREWWHRRYAGLGSPPRSGWRFRVLTACGGAMVLAAVGYVVIMKDPAEDHLPHVVRVEQVTVPSVESFHRIRAVLRNDSVREELVTKVDISMNGGLLWMCTPMDRTYRVRGGLRLDGGPTGEYELSGQIDEKLSEGKSSIGVWPSAEPVVSERLSGTLRSANCGRWDMDLWFDAAVRLPARRLVFISVDVPQEMRAGSMKILMRHFRELAIIAHLENPAAAVKSCHILRASEAIPGISATPKPCG